MYTFAGPSRRHGARLIAVMQAILLLSAMVLAPVQVIAQETEASQSQEQVNELIVEAPATAETTARPGPATEDAERQRPDPERSADSGTRPAVETAPAEPAVKLRLFPKQLKLFPGGKKVISAWTCPADDRSPWGADKRPGTGDDACQPATAKWSVRDAGVASIWSKAGHKTRIKLNDGRDTKIVAVSDGLTRKAKLIAK